MDEKRIKAIKVSNDLIVDLFKDAPAKTTTMPEDASFVRLYHDDRSDAHWIVVWSSEFEPLPEGAVIPRLNIEISEK